MIMYHNPIEIFKLIAGPIAVDPGNRIDQF
jgi:hypothetical protein